MNRRRLQTALRYVVPTFAAVTMLATAGMASAQSLTIQTKCPPGSWFCVEGKVQIGTPQRPPPPPPPPPVVVAPPPMQPPVIIYQPGPAPQPPPQVYYPPVRYVPPPPPPQILVRPAVRYAPELGINLRLEGAAFGRNDTYGGAAGMGGAGASFRFRPSQRFAFDIGADFLGGTDGNGDRRTESAVSVVGFLYMNVNSPVQFYMLGGLGFSSATVSKQTYQLSNGRYYDYIDRVNYGYFGGLFGAGLELRVARKVALNFDVRGILRSRIDSKADSQPEFVRSDGAKTNTSGGALFTGGVTFYF